MKKMNKFFTFTVINEIKTKLRPKATIVGGHARVYTPKTTTSYENLIKTVYQNSGGPFFGSLPLKVKIKAYFTPSQEIERYIKQNLLPHCINQKDLDNIAKIILDSLNGIAFKDDKQVCQLEISKAYSDTGQDYVSVEICSLEEGSLDYIKEQAYYQKLWNRRSELEAKTKLTSTEKKRLEEIKKELDAKGWLPF